VQPELALARLHDDAKQRDTARKLIEQAVKAAPADAGVLLASAQWYLGQNDLETAKSMADTALKADPKSLDGKIVRGAIARMARDYKTAERFFNEAHVQSPSNFAASNSLALVLIEATEKESQQRAMEMAEANVAMYRENSPQQVNALTTLAWIYYRLGRREDAERILDQISRNNALTTDGAYYIARILSDRGEKDRARQILEEVLRNEPTFATRPDAVDLLAKLKPAEGG
jgi:tetratricopeptide (TPR) repeat protein